MKAALTTILLTLLMSMGAWAKDSCTKSRMACPNNSTSCIDEFWEKYANNMKGGIEEAAKELPKMLTPGYFWLHSSVDTDKRLISNIWKFTKDVSFSKKDIEKFEREMVKEQCLLPLMCGPPGLKLRISVFDLRDDLLVDFYMTRESCKHN